MSVQRAIGGIIKDDNAAKFRDLSEVVAFILLLTATPVVTGVLVHRHTGSVPKTALGVFIALLAAPGVALFVFASAKHFMGRRAMKVASPNRPNMWGGFSGWAYDSVRAHRGDAYRDRHGVCHPAQV